MGRKSGAGLAAMVFLLLVAGFSVQQCEALESSTGKNLRGGLHAGEEEEEDYDLDTAYAGGRVDDDGEEGDLSDFEGIDMEDEFDGEERLEEGVDDGEGNEFDESDVVVLGSGNFSEFVKSNRYVLVEFYAPWCGHCQSLAPEYAAAATILTGEAALAKVDATDNHLLAQEFGVEGYPTLVFFTDGLHRPFSGQRRKDDMVDWVRKRTRPSVSSLDSKADAEKILDSEKEPITIALLNSLEGSEMEEYTSAARQVDAVVFYQTGSEEVATVFNFPKDVKRPALVLLKRQPEKVSWFDGPFQRDAIEAFVTKNKLPLIIPFTEENNKLIFESPIKKQIILFAAADDYVKTSPSFMEASKALMGRLLFVHVDLDSEHAPGILEYFGASGETASVMGYESKENGLKFFLEGKITAENVKVFGESFLSDSLKPFLKSAPIPETNDGDVKIVVGSNLDDIVLDETKDVFLEIYAPWCGHCQAMEPTWEKLAKRLRGVESIVIAKMDGTRNEHARAKPDGFPTLLFYPAGKKSFDPITFGGDRTVKAFVTFLKQQAAIPFTVPKKPSNTVKAPEPTRDAGAEDSFHFISDDVPEPSLKSVIDDSLNSRKDEL